jgi:mono/diheme cytochrome c family protein
MARTTKQSLFHACWLSILLAIIAASYLSFGDAAEPSPQTVEFNRDIRPILSDTCFTCHGPDKARRKADLRLDTEEGAFADLGNARVIAPGNLAKSAVYERITSKIEKQRMPPASSARQLTERQIQLIARWIQQGAKWQKHWAFIPPQCHVLPPVKSIHWPRNAIDFFILERLEREGLTPSPEADKTTLIRRVTLDLTGLPPTPAEVDVFLADSSPDAYEKVVDRLLASPRYGERMAARWLDAARYADTNGYQSDGERTMWRWRDWVIDAFNKNMPFNQFTIEQLAGDLLPNATLEQKIATGFNRNHRGNAEGGIIPEEYAVEYVADRVETTATVWMGLTLTCSRCHDHKYDPIKQKEFYQLFAFFNNVPERGKAIKYGNSPPLIKAPTPEQQETLAKLEAELLAAEKHYDGLHPRIVAAQAEWEKSLKPSPPIHWTPPHHMTAHFPLDNNVGNIANGEPKPGKFVDGEPAYVPGRIGQAADFDGKRFIDVGNVGNFTFYDKFTLSAWIYPRGPKGGTILSRMKDTARADGYSVRLEGGKIHVNLVKRWLDDAARVETDRARPSDRWYHVLVTYDGSRIADGIKVYIDGQPEKLKVLLDDLNQSFNTSEPFRIGAGGGPEYRFHGAIDEVRVYNDSLSGEDAKVIANTDAITDIAALAAEKRAPVQATKIQRYFLEKHAPGPIREARQRVLSLSRQRQQLMESLPTTMVMEEMKQPRDTFLLIRGEYDKRGDKVGPGVPAVLNPLPKPSLPGAGLGLNRLDFARWLVDPAHPLTARVAVNRYWQSYFGTGLVKTIEDFGVQGEWPSHPELLDWLATEFSSPSLQPSPTTREGARSWDIKALQRLIVTSATYRQSSHVTKILFERDPENRMLARGPRFRLSAEAIRDQALAVSGLFAERIGGPSVKPYQPAGLWGELGSGDMLYGDYHHDKGSNLYRRGLYTFWKRTVPAPSMMTFDAAGREMCVVRETRTNTPLQALNLMNDVTFVEAARVLAQRIMMEAGLTPAERLTLAFRLATARPPRPTELQVLVNGLQQHMSEYRKNPKSAMKLVSMGEYPRNEKLDVAEVAAYTAVAGLILNLDETITKE